MTRTKSRTFLTVGLGGALLTGLGLLVLTIQSYSPQAEASAGVDQPVGLADVAQPEIPSLADYNLAVAQTAKCIEGQGIAVELVPAGGLRPAMFSYSVSAGESGSPSSADLATVAGCRSEHLAAVEVAFVAAQQAPDAAQVNALFESIEECARSGGAPGEPVAANLPGKRYGERALSIAPEDMQHYVSCGLKAYAETGLKPPVPAGG